jgi:hypothetical protein
VSLGSRRSSNSTTPIATSPQTPVQKIIRLRTIFHRLLSKFGGKP